MKLLVIGIDGCDPELAQRYMPSLASLGKIQKIQSYANSGPAWASLVTGRSPEEHGVGNLNLDTSIDMLKVQPIWRTYRGRIGVANLSIAERAVEVNGWFIGGILCPTVEKACYPPALSRKLVQLDYKIHLTFGGWGIEKPEISNEEIERQWKQILPARTKAYEYLLNKHSVDLGILIYTVLDSIQHRYMHRPEKIREWYLRVDNQISRLFKYSRKIIVISDHGAKRRRWLRELLLHPKRTYFLFKKEGLLGLRTARVITGAHSDKALFVANFSCNIERIEDVYQLMCKE